PRSIPIGEELHRVLSRIPRPIHGGHVFLYNGKPIVTDRYYGATQDRGYGASSKWPKTGLSKWPI
ncbi:MAG: hypothetical protein V1758_14915, partial [Pseudomonadota bacterium]